MPQLMEQQMPSPEAIEPAQDVASLDVPGPEPEQTLYLQQDVGQSKNVLTGATEIHNVPFPTGGADYGKQTSTRHDASNSAAAAIQNEKPNSVADLAVRIIQRFAVLGATGDLSLKGNDHNSVTAKRAQADHLQKQTELKKEATKLKSEGRRINRDLRKWGKDKSKNTTRTLKARNLEKRKNVDRANTAYQQQRQGVINRVGNHLLPGRPAYAQTQAVQASRISVNKSKLTAKNAETIDAYISSLEELEEMHAEGIDISGINPQSFAPSTTDPHRSAERVQQQFRQEVENNDDDDSGKDSCGLENEFRDAQGNVILQLEPIKGPGTENVCNTGGRFLRWRKIAIEAAPKLAGILATSVAAMSLVKSAMVVGAATALVAKTALVGAAAAAAIAVGGFAIAVAAAVAIGVVVVVGVALFMNSAVHKKGAVGSVTNAFGQAAQAIPDLTLSAVGGALAGIYAAKLGAISAIKGTPTLMKHLKRQVILWVHGGVVNLINESPMLAVDAVSSVHRLRTSTSETRWREFGYEWQLIAARTGLSLSLGRVSAVSGDAVALPSSLARQSLQNSTKETLEQGMNRAITIAMEETGEYSLELVSKEALERALSATATEMGEQGLRGLSEESLREVVELATKAAAKNGSQALTRESLEEGIELTATKAVKSKTVKLTAAQQRRVVLTTSAFAAGDVIIDSGVTWYETVRVLEIQYHLSTKMGGDFLALSQEDEERTMVSAVMGFSAGKLTSVSTLRKQDLAEEVREVTEEQYQKAADEMLDSTGINYDTTIAEPPKKKKVNPTRETIEAATDGDVATTAPSTIPEDATVTLEGDNIVIEYDDQGGSTEGASHSAETETTSVSVAQEDKDPKQVEYEQRLAEIRNIETEVREEQRHIRKIQKEGSLRLVISNNLNEMYASIKVQGLELRRKVVGVINLRLGLEKNSVINPLRTTLKAIQGPFTGAYDKRFQRQLEIQLKKAGRIWCCCSQSRATF